MEKKHLSDEEYERRVHGATLARPVIRISVRKAFVIVSTAILASAGASIWGTLRVANSIPFRVDAMEKEVNVIKQTFMPLDLSLEKWKNNEADHQQIEDRLKSIESKIDSIRNLIK